MPSSFKLSDDGREPVTTKQKNGGGNNDLSTKTMINSSKISILPCEVVDQIAAGEVVQRPASVIKELIENCLDAGSTQILVHIEKGGLTKIEIKDDGRGIPKDDLALAATRHATSKLSSVQDFKTLQTFGFRGEALASISMVSKLTITTRATSDCGSVAYTQSYKNGCPTFVKPKPCARQKGTTITITDLFYNVPHRLNTYQRRESDEYNKILQVIQFYSIHYAHQASFCCQRIRGSGSKKSLLVDLNTSQLSKFKDVLMDKKGTDDSTSLSTEHIHAIKKQVISHIFDAKVEPFLECLECNYPEEEEERGKIHSSSNNHQHNNNNNEESSSLDYQVSCKGYYSSPSYVCDGGKASTKLVIFLNNRLVEIPILKRTLEDVYGEFTKSKPILVLDITVPGSQVDVNVHPSKKQVALMYQEEILKLISTTLRSVLQQHGQSFQIQSVVPPKTNKMKNPYTVSSSSSKKTNNDLEKEDDGSLQSQSKKRKGVDDDGQQPPSSQSSTKKKTKKTPPSQLIRTSGATPVGAIEPFLVKTQQPKSSTQMPSTQQASSSQLSSNSSQQPASPSSSMSTTERDDGNLTLPSSPTANSKTASQPQQQHNHKTGCPLADVDLSQPGAFASISKCLCDQILLAKPSSTSTIIRPKKVIPTKCNYKSIASLRKKINKHLSTNIAKQIREGYFVGVVSYQRSLIQCGEELVLINHIELAKELFYQLALARFGGDGATTMAKLGGGGNTSSPAATGGLNIHTLIAQALQLEDTLASMSNDNITDYKKEPSSTSASMSLLDDDLEEDGLLSVNDTNYQLAQDATSCLVENSEMLEEYFCIQIGKPKKSSSPCTNTNGGDGKIGDDNEESNAKNDDAVLTGLPILLDGHTPQPHGLGIFLFRLATQVNWKEEKACFKGVCEELGNFYSMLPACERGDIDDDVIAYIRHQLFPAISYLLLPPERVAKEGNFTVMTKLSTLYKVFERC